MGPRARRDWPPRSPGSSPTTASKCTTTSAATPAATSWPPSASPRAAASMPCSSRSTRHCSCPPAATSSSRTSRAAGSRRRPRRTSPACASVSGRFWPRCPRCWPPFTTSVVTTRSETTLMPDHVDRKLEIVTAVPESAMVVFAHPDDGEIGSGGVIATWVAAGCEVSYVLCTNGEAGTADRDLTPEALVRKREHEQRAAADFMGVRHVEMLGYPDGRLEDTREFLGDVVRAIRRHRPHTVFVHDPYRIKGFQHRDHRKAGIVTTDAVYPYARDHLHFPEHITREGLEPHKVRELWYWGADEPAGR